MYILPTVNRHNQMVIKLAPVEALLYQKVECFCQNVRIIIYQIIRIAQYESSSSLFDKH